MNRALTALLLTTALAVLGACASGSSSSSSGASTATENKTAAEPAKPAEAAKPAAAVKTPPPAGHPFSKITVGMNDTDVRKLLGEPDSANGYMTGKQFIPFYHGPDTSRTDWMYKGKGRIVFSRNAYSGTLKVIDVLYNPSEP